MGDDNWKAAKRRLVKRKKQKGVLVWYLVVCEWDCGRPQIGVSVAFLTKEEEKKKVALRVHNPAASALEESRKRRVTNINESTFALGRPKSSKPQHTPQQQQQIHQRIIKLNTKEKKNPSVKRFPLKIVSQQRGPCG